VKQDISRKIAFFHTLPAFDALVKVGASNDGRNFWHRGRQVSALKRGAKILTKSLTL